MDLAAHLHRVVEVEVLGEHRLRIAFDDGARGEIDASDWTWRGVFAPLRDPSYFAQVELDAELDDQLAQRRRRRAGNAAPMGRRRARPSLRVAA